MEQKKTKCNYKNLLIITKRMLKALNHLHMCIIDPVYCIGSAEYNSGTTDDPTWRENPLNLWNTVHWLVLGKCHRVGFIPGLRCYICRATLESLDRQHKQFPGLQCFICRAALESLDRQHMQFPGLQCYICRAALESLHRQHLQFPALQCYILYSNTGVSP